MIWYVFLAVFSSFALAEALPQTFTETYTFCEYVTVTNKRIEFPNKLWTVDTKNFLIHFSLCNPQAKCRNQTSSCLVNKQNKRQINFGHEFIPDDYDDSRFISQSGAQCPNSPTNYTLTVTLQCSDSAKPKPFLASSQDDCAFEITMLHPQCAPKCTQIVSNAYLLDLRAFRRNIEVNSDAGKFSLTVCGPNRYCERGASTCNITSAPPVSLVELQSQRINYDAGKNELTARGRYKRGRDVKLVEILIKCDWQANDVKDPVYVKPQNQGKTYRFELKSSYGCVILPHNCRINSIDNLNYDLSRLNKPAGWTVAGVPQGSINLNICGPLRRPRNICADQYSQVCHSNNGKHANRGSVLASLKAENDVVRAVFVSGSRCEEEPHLLHSTHVEFTCYKLEDGPRFQKYNTCITYLTWKTPYACPVDLYTGQNCYINDRVSSRSLRNLYNQTDRTYQLSPNAKSEIVYNLCGPIHSTCNGFSNVSFCLKKQAQEVVLGWDRRELISENGRLRLESNGNTCGRIVVEFVCSYETPARAPHINVIEDGCRFNLTVFTSLACFTNTSFNNCVLKKNSTSYDLSALSLKNKNYVVQSGQNLEYVLNVCGPVVSGPNALCRGDTMVCLRNKTEVIKKYQFRSLGGVGGLSLVNNSLILEAPMGAYCPGFGHYKSIIHFECATQRNAPVLLPSMETCVYQFLWKTPEACPHSLNCMINGTKADQIFDLTPLQKKTMNVNVGNNTSRYEFNMCEDSYMRYVDDIPYAFSLKRVFLESEEKPFLIFDLNSGCNDSNTIDKINFKTKCSYSVTDRFEKTSFENCTLNMTIWTHIVCPEIKEVPVLYSIAENLTTAPNLPVVAADETPTNSKITNCLVVNGNTGYKFALDTLQPQQIFGSKNFAVNFDANEKDCAGLVCKNSETVVPLHTCPTVFFNFTYELVQLQFRTSLKCSSEDSYHLEVWLKCNKTATPGRVVQDDGCKAVILYHLPEACSLLEQDIVVAKPTVAIVAGTLSGALIIVAALISIYIYRRRGEHMDYMSICYDKTSVPIYTKDSTL